MADGERASEGARDAAIVLPIAAALLLLPPVILIFAAPRLIGGVPLIVVYLFGVWAAIVLAAFLVSRRMKASEGMEDEPTDSG